MIAVIAEKPSVAKELAKVMGATKSGDGFVEGNGYIFTWAFGHLVQPAPPEAYGFTEWKKENLPMLPNPFKIVGKMEKKGKEWKEDSGAKKQLRIIKECFEKASEIVVATDAGREGELIFRYIYQHLNCKKPFRRLWISSFTDKAIIDGFKNLKDGKLYDSLFHSARCRSEADWLVGMNATRALSLTVGVGLYSLGRVQTPTLSMICARYLKNKSHKKEFFYVIKAVGKKNTEFILKSEKKWSDKNVCEAVCRTLGKEMEVVKYEKKEAKDSVPLLYDLTELQRDGNKKLSLSADDTLGIAQKLYECKYITYPRTGSRYISEDVYEQTPHLISCFRNNENYKKWSAEYQGRKLNKKSVNDEKVTDHHALLPTENIPSDGLSEKERAIYDLIVSRMFESFGEDCLKRVSKVQMKGGEELFVAAGTEILKQGWRSIRGKMKEEDKDDEEDEEQVLPDFTTGEKVSIVSKIVVEKQTKPLPIHTEASLLSAMEVCGKEIEDAEAREAMKEGGLGTPATRAAIIETLFARGYIERQKKSLVPLAKGLSVYEFVKEKDIAKAGLTGGWEKKLALMASGKYAAEEFNKEIREYASSLTQEIMSGGVTVATSIAAGAVVCDCPKCKKGKMSAFSKGISCSDREGCNFVGWNTVAGKKISDSTLKNLIEKGSSGGSIKGFKSKSGKSFDASLKLNTTSWRVEFDFEKK